MECRKSSLLLPKGSSTLRSDSRASSTTGLDDDSAIDRHRIDPNEARNNFSTNDIKERASHGWIGTKRTAYKSTSKRVPNGDHAEGVADDSDQEDEESLERKIARLRREVSEVKEAFTKRRVKAEEQEKKEAGNKDKTGNNSGTEPLQTLDSLHHVLENIEKPQKPDRGQPSSRLIRKLDAVGKSNKDGSATMAKPTHEGDYLSDDIPSTAGYDTTHTLSRVSDFDKRLRLLETALGMDFLPLPTQDRSASQAVIPVLDGLDQRVSTMNLTETSLDKIGKQIRQMTRDTEKLAEARRAAAAASQSSTEQGRATARKTTSGINESKEDLDQTSKINALYGTLSTIESLSPLLPSVLDRLRSLRAIHADAALAGESLSKVESRQAAMAEELVEWKDGLTKVESAIQMGEKSMKGNVEAIGGWVMDLETRLQKMSSVNDT